MNTEQTDIQERMRKRALSQLMNAFVAFKRELATQGHDTEKLTLDTVFELLEYLNREPVIMGYPNQLTNAIDELRAGIDEITKTPPPPRNRTRKAK